MNFGAALEKLKSGKKVARQRWNGPNMYIFYVSEWSLTGSPVESIPVLPLAPFIAIKTAGDEIIPWLASQADMTSNDWMVVDGR